MIEGVLFTLPILTFRSQKILFGGSVGIPVIHVVVIIVEMEYSVEQRIFVVEKFHQSKRPVEVQRAFRKRFGCKNAPTRSAISKMVKKFHEVGQVTDQKKGKCGRKVTKSTPENVGRVQAAMTQSPKKSVRRASQQLELSYGTVHKILRKSLR